MKSIDLVGQWECSGRYRNMVRRCWVKSIGLKGKLKGVSGSDKKKKTMSAPRTV